MLERRAPAACGQYVEFTGEGVALILEVAILDVRVGQSGAFKDVLRDAQHLRSLAHHCPRRHLVGKNAGGLPLTSQCPGYISHELQRLIETTHVDGFRRSPG